MSDKQTAAKRARELYDMEATTSFFEEAWELFPDYNTDPYDAADHILTRILEENGEDELSQEIVDNLLEEIIDGLT